MSLSSKKDGSYDKFGVSTPGALETDEPWISRFTDVLRKFWSLGFIAFGGPQAHIAILRDELVVKAEWIGEEQFTELFAIGQGLPGPTSTQLVVSCATSRAGPVGGVVALLMWNMPGLIVQTTCGVLVTSFIDPDDPPFYLAGLAPAAIALLFKAAYGFSGQLDKLGCTMALVSCIVSVIIAGDNVIDKGVCQWVYPLLLVLGSVFCLIDSKRENSFGTTYTKAKPGWDSDSDLTFKRIGIPLWVGAFIFLLWAAVLAGCLIIRAATTGEKGGYLALFETMFRVGSIIFGGGQVVLPMLYGEVVDTGWISSSTFYQGFALAQSLPGPLFNFSSFVGGAYLGVGGALIAYLGLFGPGVILIFAMMPFWSKMRHIDWFKAVLVGLANTAIGFVFAACFLMYQNAVTSAASSTAFAVAGVMAMVYKYPAPACIFGGGVVGALLNLAELGQKPY
ncbi:hypothetical protein TrVE_jg13395 [Triparma verrucosa]|uniref:Chromate transporter n=1 Tax=Triparma verrucosa TaxID=1606542 RepID=A0A9W7BTN2_9STRA|nr:hypothetical protein TrVE_jg13395 [Triparma verrucosa]